MTHAILLRRLQNDRPWISFTPNLPSGLMLTYSQTEGSWEEVTRVIGQAHALLHGKGVVRIQSDIRIGSRIDKAQTMEDKVSAVEKLLASDK